ncbi:hemerythrin [Ornatilinea apprima]|uniref:Hemerythrin n=1 Tax=Ornatilinea apprima TaxID=1134406 RepID=A0A0P6X216_9CHLR|nr:bacteriohemerythrin [Ornatilinea apprima]KPL76552.1 hemerythrin [Ornatilinea apprima]
MPIMKWMDEYSVQVAELDQQHQKLIELINLLHDEMRQGKGRESLGRILDQLIEYTRVHFTTEEDWMARAGYAGLAAHREEHRALTRQVEELQDQHRAGSRTLSLEVMVFLKDWLVNHIQKTDQKYSDVLKEYQRR